MNPNSLSLTGHHCSIMPLSSLPPLLPPPSPPSPPSPLTPQEVTEWCERCLEFHSLCQVIKDMYGRLTAIPNRPLLYDVYQYMWDAKETTQLLDSYISCLGKSSGVVNIPPDLLSHILKLFCNVTYMHVCE